MSNDLKSPIIIKYQNLYKEDPHSRVFAPLAEAYRKFGMVVEAIEILQKGIREHPDFTLGHLGLAHCYFDQQKFQLCYETLRPLVEANRENLRLQKLFAKACLELSKNKEALETYKYLLYMNPKDEDAAKNVESLEQGFSTDDFIEKEIKNDEFVPSEKFSVESISDSYLESADNWVKVDLEQTQQEEQVDESENWQMQQIPELQEVEQQEALPVEIETESEGVSLTLVDLMLEQGAKEKAIEILEKIVELNPTDKQTIERLELLRRDTKETKEDTLLQEKIAVLTRFQEAITQRKSEKGLT